MTARDVARSGDWQMFLPGPLAYRYYRKSKAVRARASAAAFDRALATLDAGSTVLDLGANVGKFTRILAATGARVHAFEPDPETVGVLRGAVADLSNVTVHHAAIGAGAGTVRLYRAKGYAQNKQVKSLGASVTRTDPFAMDLRHPIDVEMVDFFEFLAGLERPAALVKMDIEGAEWPILDALASGRGAGQLDTLFVETHERFNPWRDMPRLRRLMRFAETSQHPRIDLNWT